jgi:putative transposase
LKAIGPGDDREIGSWLGDRVENSCPPFRRRRRAMLRFRCMRTIQRLVSIHAWVHNRLATACHLQNHYTDKMTRAASHAECRGLLLV